jgi:outer membrane protein assembly factor BamA
MSGGRAKFSRELRTGRGKGGERSRSTSERLPRVMSARGDACSAWIARRPQKHLAGLALFLGLFGWAFSFRVAAADSTNLPPVLPPPEMLTKRSPLPDLLLKDKRTGSYFTGFPAVGWDPESKFNYGAAVQWYDNGPADSPFFRYTPYRRQVAVAASGSTGGTRRALIGYDHPYVADSPWRIRSAAFYEENKFQNYFGVGESTLGPLTFPGSTKKYDNFEDYERALEQVVNGQTWARYNDYHRRQAGATATIERDFLGGRLRPLLGFQFSHIDVRDYTGETIDGAVMQPTRLFTDFQSGKIVGFEGGWDNALKVGLTFDTRDFEPDAASGVMLQVAGRLASEVLGSTFDYQQFTLSARGFHNLLRDPGRLILAGRVTYVITAGDAPFYSASTIPFTEADTTGLGGHSTLRGFVTDRFVGEAMAYANAELRWSFAEKVLWRQHLRFMLVPFVDTGSVFNSVSRTTLNQLKVDAGIGFRLAWNLSTVVSFDYARSGEGSQFFMELGHQF